MSEPPTTRIPRRREDLTHPCSVQVCKTTGKPCKNESVNGTTVCRMHGAGAPQVKLKASREVAQWTARRELERLGAAVDVHPAEALLEMVREAAGNVAWLRGRVGELDQRAGLVALPSDAEQLFRAEGIYGPDHQGDGKRHILVAMYDEERDRLAKVAKMALDVGIDERRVRLAERQGEAMVAVVVAVIDGLGLDAAQRERARQLAGAELRRLGTGAE